ncbi:hypothetical protein EJB05_33798, partial [Eragrostis curvula]
MPPLYISLIILFLSLHAPSSSASDDTLMAGQTLGAGDKLVSRNGKFALGFFQPSIMSKSGKTTTSPNWYLGIWFNREKPIPAHDLKLTRLKISGDGNLVIVNLAGSESIIWSTHFVNTTVISTNTTHAILLNTGNLALMGSPSTNVTFWQSFDYPADVLLPNAKIGFNKITGLQTQFVSRKNLIDPSPGSDCTDLEANGVLVHKSCNNSADVYWSWGPVSSSGPNKLVPLFNSLIDINPETKGLISLSYFESSEEAYYKYTLQNESYHLFFLQDTFGGQVKLIIWSQAQQSWQTKFAHPASPCTAYGTCGPFTVCNGISSPSCECMESFSQNSPRDWELHDTRGGCVRDNPLDCTSEKNTTKSTDIFHPIARVTLPYNPQILEDATTQSKCAEACLSYCTCTAYSYNNNVCFVWHGELLHVKQNDGIENSSEEVLYLRLAAKNLPSSLRKSKRKPITGVYTAAIIISCGLLMITLLLLIIWRNKFKWFRASVHGTPGSDGIIAFKYNDLAHATKNFSEQLGAGGFGSVFKGVLTDLTIAVKKLNETVHGEKQFRAEVSSLGLIQHINLVKLIGFCCEGDKKLLVYEHMLHGSLDAHRFVESSASALNWSTRYQIIVGVARGLSYLHQSCHKCIIHCDIKPENILLDASFVPKIADFGMAAAVGRDFSRVLTTFRGTVGYLAPEWLSGVAITPKVDVYSFGMVLFEIISGRRNTPEACSGNGYQHVGYFPVQAIRKLHEGDVRSLMDPHLHGDIDLEEAERVCKVACWCIQDDELNRPTMSEVARVLEGLQMVGMPPVPRLLAAMTERSDAGAV